MVVHKFIVHSLFPKVSAYSSVKPKKKQKKKGSDSESDGSDMEFNPKDIGPARDRPGIG